VIGENLPHRNASVSIIDVYVDRHFFERQPLCVRLFIDAAG
jgi:hypothetical protein